MSECSICGMKIEHTAHFVVYDDETLCMTCFERITQYRESVE